MEYVLRGNHAENSKTEPQNIGWLNKRTKDESKERTRGREKKKKKLGNAREEGRKDREVAVSGQGNRGCVVFLELKEWKFQRGKKKNELFFAGEDEENPICDLSEAQMETRASAFLRRLPEFVGIATEEKEGTSRLCAEGRIIPVFSSPGR